MYHVGANSIAKAALILYFFIVPIVGGCTIVRLRLAGGR